MVRKIGVALGMLLFIALLLGAWIYAGGRPTAQTGSEAMRVVCIQTKDDADSTLLVQPSAAILIDTGEAVDAEQILQALADEGVTELDYLILTHNDADHIGSAQAILERVPTRMVVQSYVAHSTEQSRELAQYLADSGTATLSPTKTARLQAGDMRLVVYPPLEKNYSQSNNTSLAVLVQHGSVRLFLAGDALRKRSEELLMMNLPQVELYHVAHHGRANTATAKLVETLAPQYAVVTAQTADTAVQQAAAQCGAQLLYTASGNIVFESDSKQLQMRDKTSNEEK